MARRSLFSIVVSGAGLLAPLGGPALAQQAPPWNEGPGDIVILREVPHQNAVLVGEPGRPTLINPKSIIDGTIASALGAGLFRPLSDMEADDVRARRSARNGLQGESFEMLASSDDGVGFSGAETLGHDRTGLIGGVVSGTVGNSTRQLQDILSSALGRGRQP